MVFDFRVSAKDDWRSKTALVSKNVIEEGGFRLVSLVRYAKRTSGKQTSFLSGLNISGRVGRDQGSVIGLGNYAGRVDRNQGFVVGLGNYAGRVGEDQEFVIGLGNYAGRVDRDQGFFIGLGNYAGRVGRNQGFAFGLGNYAQIVKGTQRGGLFSVQTRNRTAKQKHCLIRYNPLEKVGMGSSVFSKIAKADSYLEELLENEHSRKQEVLEAIADRKPTFRKKITGHWTYRDVLTRQARKALQSYI